MPDHLLGCSETSAYLGISEYTLRRMARDGQIPAFKVASSWRFRQEDLDAWLRGLSKPPANREILLVDDEESIHSVLRDILRDAGYRTRSALTGEAALQMISENDPDLVILDLHMPDMDGPTVFGKIRKSWHDTPVIILTGHPEGELMMRAMQYGPITLLAKPVSADQLLESVRTVFHGARIAEAKLCRKDAHD